MRKSIPLFAALLLLSGCETPRPHPYEYPPSYEPSPPPPALRAPAAARPAAPAPVARNVKPLGVGPLKPQTVEAYTDTEETELRVNLRGSGVIVGRQGNNLVLGMKSDPLFEPGSTSLSSRGAQIVQAIALVIRKYDSTQLQVNGYTDTTGAPDRNMKVSQDRADAIARALGDDGVDGRRIAAHGFGETNLKIPTGAEVNEPRNRRVEIRILPRMAA
jgi:outer membrane protein OmpA-like peptidoglycan-associated protein